MKKINVLFFIIVIALLRVGNLSAQIGYFDAPYVRYEADLGTLTNGAAATAKSYAQGNLQSEASDQICVNMFSTNASVSWPVTADGDGLVVRYSVPDGQSGAVDVYANGTNVGTLNLTTYYSWEYLSSNGNPNNVGVSNTNPKMRFDEVRMKLPAKILAGGTLKLVRTSGNVTIDFAELEPIPAAVSSSAGDAIFTGGDLQTFITNNGGKTIYLPAGSYSVGSTLYFGAANTTLKGAGMWYTQINFTSGNANDGGLWGQASNISYSGLYLTTDRNSRSSSYKAINGVYTSGSTITNVWEEHFECGAWIAQFGAGPSIADGFKMSYCRFRNNYADGTNLSKGTSNSIVEHCSYRNNGDDDMAIWPANGQSCDNNTFRFNTAENSWRASGCAIYGGTSNIAHDLLIKDNLEAGLRANNSFDGAPFNTGGQHQFYNIRIISGGTYNDLFNSPVGAIDLLATNTPGTGSRVYNVKFSCIEIIDAKNDGIFMNRINSGDGFYNLVFENISINGTGREYPNNSAGGANGGIRGYELLIAGSPGGSSTYCNITYANRGGNATVNANTGSYSWNAAGTCPGGCSLPSSNATTITSASTFGICNNPITLTATTTAPSGSTVSYVEFFVDGTSIGQDNTSSYSMTWNSPTVGSHLVTAVAHYSNGTTSSSVVQNVTVADGVYSTGTPPIIDGTIDGMWSSFPSFPLTKLSEGTTSGAADLSATFKITRDATNLYILVNVTDDVLRNDGVASWQDDEVELFIDMGNTKSSSYASNDYQYNFVYNVATAITGVTYAQGSKTGGYIMEIKIPWSTLGGAPTAGSFMGFDVGVDDNDTGTRDAKIDWSDLTDNAWQNPSVFGTLQIAGCASPLPVELITFTGEVQNETIVLNWATATEKNNDKFVIERSGDASNWTVIGERAGAGNAVSVVNYTFPDYTAPNGMVYYRLKQIDVDGAFTYSKITAVENSSKHAVTLMPNPFDEAFTVSSHITGNVDIKIYDVLGTLLFHENKEMNEGLTLVQPDLPGGAYVIVIQSNEVVERQTIVKK